MNKRTSRITSLVLLHAFGGLMMLQGLPAHATSPYPILSNLTPLEACNDPLASASTNVIPNMMVIVDTSGSMEETSGNKGLRTGGDDPRSKMSILKRALSKLMAENSDKINIGFSTYNQQVNTSGSPVTFKYDFDYVYAKDPLTTTGSETLITTSDPSSSPPPTGVVQVPTGLPLADPLYPYGGQYFYDEDGDGVTIGDITGGIDYTLVGSFIPAVGGAPAATASDLAVYNWLWVRNGNLIPGTISNYNSDTWWHAHDTYLGSSDTYLDLSCGGDHSPLGLTFVGSIINNDYWYDLSSTVDANVDSEPAACPDKHRIRNLDSSAGESLANDHEMGWHRYVSIDTSAPYTSAHNPRLSKILNLMNHQSADLTDDGWDGDGDVDNPGNMDSDADTTGLVARGNTPLFQSMMYAYEYFARLIDPGESNKYSIVYGANNTDSTLPSVASDPQSAVLNPNGCRRNFLLIVTDGKSTNTAGFATWQDAVDDLMIGTGPDGGLTDLGVKVLVVGFSLDGTGGDQVTRIAQQSDLDTLPNDPAPDVEDTITTPFLATNEPTLLSSLQAAFAAVAAGKLNTSSPVLGTNLDVISGHTSTNRYGNAETKVQQNVLVSSFAELPSFNGHVQQFRLFDYDASHDVVIPNPPTLLWDAGSRTSSRSLVLTSYPGGGANPLERAQFLPLDVIPGGGTGGPFDTTSSDFNSIRNEMEAGNNLPSSPSMNNDDWSVLIRWVRDSYGLETGPGVGAMGAPILASPAVVGPPLQEPAPDSEYVSYASVWRNRPTMVYQAANDGMIHAIVGGLTQSMGGSPAFTWDDGFGTKSYYGGDELWAYVPMGILNSLVKFDGGQANSYPPGDLNKYASGSYLVGQAVSNHKFLISADLVTADVKIDDPTVSGDTLEWKTVIMGGYGPGNEGFWCIDVTNPQDPKQLWDTDDEWSTTQKETLGLTYSTPRIGKIRIMSGSAPQTKYVAFVGSGYHEGRDASEDATSIDRGKTFYILDMSTGEILYDYTVDDPGDTVNENKLVGSVATVDENFDGFVDSAFIGDLEGRMWKFGVDNGTGTVLPPTGTTYGGTTPVPYFFDDDPVLSAVGDFDANYSMGPDGNSLANTGIQPIITAPSVTMQYYSDGSTSGYAPVAFFGTGGDGCADQEMTASDRNFIDAFIDPDDRGDITPRGKIFCVGDRPLLELSQNERLAGNPVVLGTKAYITTFKKDPTLPCSKGQGIGYIVDFGGCLTEAGYSTGSATLTDLTGTTTTPGTGTALGPGVPGGIAAGPGGVYMISEGGTITAIQGGAGPDGTGTCEGCINPQPSVGTAGQVWREEER